jgi:hypothetical protein
MSVECLIVLVAAYTGCAFICIIIFPDCAAVDSFQCQATVLGAEVECTVRVRHVDKSLKRGKYPAIHGELLKQFVTHIYLVV